MKLRHEIVVVLLLLVVAAPSRLLALDVLPPGLWHDEAYEGIDAVRILAGARPVFLPENYGREPLFAYVMAGLIALDGPTAVAVRATAALFGLLTVPAAYFWGRVLFGRSIGLLVAALTTASYWILQESRLGMRPISLPLFLALSSALCWLAARRGRSWAWPLAGLCLGLSLYTYLPARLFPLVLASQAGLGLWARRLGGRASWRSWLGALGMLGVAALVGLPLALYFRANPDDLAARSSVVSIFASDEGRAHPLAVLLQNLLLNLGEILWRGDDTLRHNLPYRPVFDIVLAPFVLLGAVTSVRRLFQTPISPGTRERSALPPQGRRGRITPPLAVGEGGTLTRSGGEGSDRTAHAALWFWLVIMLVPGVLSDSAPHFLRTIGLLPALFALPAVGLVTGADWLRSRLARSARPARAALVPIVGVVAIVGVSQALTWWDYFVRLPREPGLAETFDAPRAALARVAGDPPPGLDLSLPTPGWSYATIRFLRHHDFGTPRPAYSTEFRFDRQVVLLGYDLEPDPLPAERTGRLTLYWRALREMNASYVRGARLVDQYNRVWWEAAGEPGFGTLPTDTWEPGEVVADHLRVDLTPGTPPGSYQVEISLAQPGGGRKLTIFDPAGRSIGSALRLPDVRVGGGSGG